MSSERAFHATVLAVTIAALFAIFKFTNIFGDPHYELLALLASILTGAGLYETITKAVEITLDSSRFLKKLILWSSYLEGKWAGFYLGERGPRFVIEVMRQEWSAVHINGQAFTEDNDPHGQWHSVHAVVDGRAGLLHGTFTGEHTTGHYDSVFSFQLEGEPPMKLAGYFYDSSTSSHVGRAWTVMKKLPRGSTDADALVEARKLYRELQGQDDPSTAAPSSPSGTDSSVRAM